ncbi:MAG: TetR/AcrR family transcriptional regulator [Spirochaetes bacterium]|nr:TetR/AcrR family transcriptional regulator [Spirochaetota bacterium]
MVRREAILDTAFKIWGKTNFTQMSLTPIAKHLGITKAALYKHFQSKNELLQAMEQRFLSRYREFHEEFFKEAEGLDLSRAVHLFLEKVLRFYLGNPYFLSYFYVWLLRTRMAERAEIVPLFHRQRELFHTLFHEIGIQTRAEELEVRLHFLYICATFWVSTLFWNLNECKHPSQLYNPEPIAVKEWEPALDRWHRYCMQGLASRRGLSKEVSQDENFYKKIEKRVVFPPPPKREHDRIFQAIVDVSAEVGIRDASIERIAEKLGMSKSSLYSHFRNKRSMFESLIREEQRFMLKVLKEKLSSFSGFAERSYGFMYITLLHTLSNPSLLSLFNWFRFQNIRIPIRSPGKSFMEEYFSFFYDAQSSGELSCTQEELLPSAVLLHVLTFRSLQDTDAPSELNESFLIKIRAMHRLYLYGLSTPTLFKESV